jgi:hypothetical protein
MDADAREFVHDVLEETTEMFRTPAGDFMLESLCEEAFEEGRTRDIVWLRGRGVDAHGFYKKELAPNWEGLTREERAQRVERFIELAAVHLKVLLLAWAFDRTYGYVDQLMNGPLQYRRHARTRTERGKKRRRARPRTR